MKHTRRLNAQTWLEHMRRAQGHSQVCYAMYSSIVNGITTDPAAMAIPIDDHLVHRGDGVFESIKCLNGAIYNVGAHLDRMDEACKRVQLDLPCTREELLDIITQTIHAGGRRDCLIRVLLSRGTGTMSVDPTKCKRAELYIAVYQIPDKWLKKERYPAHVRLSKVPVKPPFFATIKSCNYLPNVLMKKEAVDLGVDFVVAIDEKGNLGEGATENFAIVTTDRQLLAPPTDHVLAGTTLKRVIKLADELVRQGDLTDARYAEITPLDAMSSAEMLVIGTTRDVLPVSQFEGRYINSGQPGPIYKKLLKLLRKDMCSNGNMRHVVYKQQG